MGLSKDSLCAPTGGSTLAVAFGLWRRGEIEFATNLFDGQE